MKFTQLDEKIAMHYAEEILLPIKYGENATFFWMPGSGTTTIINDIFGSKKILKNKLGRLASNLKIFQLWGHLPNKKNLLGILNESGFKDKNHILNDCIKLLEEGNEIVYVIGRIDDFAEKEKIELLKLFVRLQSINPRRVHIILNLMNKPWFIKTLNENPEFVCLVNRMKILPVLKGDLLEQYIKEKSDLFNYKLSSDEIEFINKTYGGILQLTKEYIRSQGNSDTLELKLKVIWNNLPDSYKEILKQLASKKPIKYTNQDISDLKEFGIFNLKLFTNHKNILDINSDEILTQILTPEEFNLLNYFKKNSGEIIDKSIIIDILRPENNEEITFWAIDKAISRFRNKLVRSGIDPIILKTVKGKGYIWTN